MDRIQTKIAAGEDVGRRATDHAMNYGEARDVALDAHKQCFPDSDPACSEKCLKAQIDRYHRQKSVGVRDGALVHTKRVGARPT